MSLRRRMDRMEADMKWLGLDAWLDRLEAYMNYADKVTDLAARAPHLRKWLNVLPDGTPKPPCWHRSLTAWEQENAAKSAAESEETNPLWVPG